MSTRLLSSRVFVVLFVIILYAPVALGQERGLQVLGREITGRSDFDLGRQVAVIIGIDKYKEWPSLKAAVAEAKAIRRVLSERYVIDEFLELYDAEATAANIRRLFIETLPAKLGPKDSLLVFYAGHGQTDATKTGFWIASDGSKDIYSQNNWIPNQQLRNMVSGLKAQRILILADACFSGDFINVSRGATATIDNAFFRKALQLTARQVLTSGASESVPDESEFGRQLLNLLERNEEAILDPVSMYERVRLGVSRTTPLLGTLPGNEEGASFALFRKGAVLGSGAGTISPSGAASLSYFATGTADLMVRTAEPGAEIYVDGVLRGQSPVLIKKLDAGRPLAIQARTPSMAGNLSVNLSPGDLKEVSLELLPRVGNLVIASNESEVRLFVDGEDRGPLGSGIVKGLPAGARRLELKGRDLYGSVVATVKPEETVEVRAHVLPVGSIRVEVPDEALVSVTWQGGHAQRRGPGLIEAVPAGTLSLSAAGEGFAPASGTLRLGRGEIASWKPWAGGFLKLSVSPEGALCFIDGASGNEVSSGAIELSPGTREVILKKPGYIDQSLKVAIGLGRITSISARLEKLAPAI